MVEAEIAIEDWKWIEGNTTKGPKAKDKNVKSNQSGS